MHTTLKAAFIREADKKEWQKGLLFAIFNTSSLTFLNFILFSHYAEPVIPIIPIIQTQSICLCEKQNTQK